MRQRLGRLNKRHSAVYGALTIMSDLKRIVQRLGDIGKVRSKGELCDDMGQIHHWRHWVRAVPSRI